MCGHILDPQLSSIFDFSKPFHREGAGNCELQGHYFVLYRLCIIIFGE